MPTEHYRSLTFQPNFKTIFYQGCIKVLFPRPWPLGGGEFIKFVGEERQVVNRGREYHGCGDGNQDLENGGGKIIKL